MKIFITTIGILAFSALALSTLCAAGSPDGRAVFEKRCTGCHATDRDKVGPRLQGIYGRKAASVSSYTYSDSLKSANVTWDDKTLDQWLADPDKLVPGNDMSFRLENAVERAAIIEYLRRAVSK